MVNCPNCGTTNTDDSLFCTHCGTPLKPAAAKQPFEKEVKQFAQDMEQTAKKVGETMSQTARQIRQDVRRQHREWRYEEYSRRFRMNWYDRTFGIFGPLLNSFVGLIVLRLVVEALHALSPTTPDLEVVSHVLLAYLLPLFGVMLLSNYTGYFSKKYPTFRVFSPLFYAVAAVAFFWILTLIFVDIGTQLHIAELSTAAASIEDNLSSIFVAVLIICFIVVLLTMPRRFEENRQENEKK